ncbi:helix-turn-helix domain-containing protein [Actinophytocola sediminis]
MMFVMEEVTPLRVRGRAIREAYARMGLTRAEFANKAGIRARTLTNVTNVVGRPTACSLANAAKIANALGWTVEDVLDRSGQPRPTERDDQERPQDTRPADKPKAPPSPPKGPRRDTEARPSQ